MSDALSLVLITPVVLGLAFIIMTLADRVDFDAQVRSAADLGAQAAATATNLAAARTNAKDIVDRSGDESSGCTTDVLIADDAQFQAATSLTVHVTCTIEGKQYSAYGYATRDPFRAIDK